ncbi:MAG: phosphoribosylanthranilate isomerase [Flavobacteriaceae bacterium]|nr:phosphoribosylanthranilate isomerase [Flavobacteriaceae bacterium]
MKLKICGLRDPKNIQDVSNLNPNYMGFIFWKSSSRFASKKIPILDQNIIKTGIFVDASIDYVKNLILLNQLKAVQLHGKETPKYCNEIQKLNVEVIKVFNINQNFNFSKLSLYEKFCDYYLFDTKGKLPGGNGINFNWSILKDYSSQKPFFLSGGIGLENFNDIKNILKSDLPIHAIDINSKFEIQPGLKNIDLLTKFKKKLNEL